MGNKYINTVSDIQWYTLNMYITMMPPAVIFPFRGLLESLFQESWHHIKPFDVYASLNLHNTTMHNISCSIQLHFHIMLLFRTKQF